jgi:predicted DNA-binding transcriptional regulator AlpA
LAFQTENSKRQFLSERLAFLMLSKSLAFLTGSFFSNFRTRITVDSSSPALTDLDRKGFPMADLPKVVTAKVAARFVGLSESTLAKLRLNGNGPVYCKLGRRVVYRPADLEQWLQSRTTRDTSDADARFLKALTVAHPR